MSADGWFTTFFDAVANDLWAAAVPDDQTAAEADFLVDALRLTPGSAVIDVAAGRGRLAFPLAARGVRVTALDRSTDGVQHIAARDRTGTPVPVVQGDMRALPFAGCFAAAFCMGNSIGYFDRDGVSRFLGELHRVLRPGGRVVLETATVAESLLRDPAERTTHSFGGITVVGRHRYDAAHGHLVSVLQFDDGTARTERTMTQLVLPLDDIRHLLSDCGFVVEHLLGGVDGAPYSPQADVLIVVATRHR